MRFHWRTRVERLGARRDGSAAPACARSDESRASEIPARRDPRARPQRARHLARLAAQGVVFEAKPFQLGVRIEHPQTLIDRARHGEGPEAALLGPAYYGLTCRRATARPARTASACARAA